MYVTCSFHVFKNGNCDGDDDDYDDGDGDDALSARKATSDTDVCHLYVLDDGDDDPCLQKRHVTQMCHLYVFEMIIMMMRMIRYLSEKLQVTRMCVTTTFGRWS